jgi:long-chain acyl-CoA synthetase
VPAPNVTGRRPGVADAAVIGVPHPHWSEAVLAVAVLAPGRHVSAPDLLDHGRDRGKHFAPAEAGPDE